MRDDMDKQLVERPRPLSRVADVYRRRLRARAKQLDMEAAPKQASMGAVRQYGWRAKDLNENLKPLERFLRSNLGRPWANVYSEIRAQLNLNNAIQFHVIQHLRQMVHQDVVLSEDGKPMRPLRYGGRGFTELSSHEYYVHPINGLLWKPRHRPDRTDKKKRYNFTSTFSGPDVAHKIVNERRYLKVEGVWYRPMFQTLSPEGPTWSKPRTYKVVNVENVDNGPRDLIFGEVGRVTKDGASHGESVYGRADVCCIGKEQLNSKELRRLGLVNDK